MNIEITLLAHVFGDRLVLGKSFTELGEVAFYNGLSSNLFGFVISTPWSYRGGGTWERRVYGVVSGRLCTTVESADPTLASQLEQRV